LKLNKETGSYVYKLISVKEIIEHPTLHGYRRSGIRLADASSAADSPDNKLEVSRNISSSTKIHNLHVRIISLTESKAAIGHLRICFGILENIYELIPALIEDGHVMDLVCPFVYTQ